MSVAFSRALRTETSERFLLHQQDGKEVGAVDLHYLADGTVSGTVILLDEKLAEERSVLNILAAIDDILLPGVDMDDNNLSFTVVTGKVVGTFIPEAS
jgi:hypothetical protein